MSTVHEELITARSRIAKYENWVTGTLCRRNMHGDDAFCAVGAVIDARVPGYFRSPRFDFGGVKIHDPVLQALGEAALQLGLVEYTYACPWNAVVRVNNQLGHAATLAMFDRAIENTKPEPVLAVLPIPMPAVKVAA